MTALIDRAREVLRDEPHLILGLELNLWNGEPFIRVSKPGKTERSKPVDLLPVIFGPEGAKLSDTLQIIVDMLREEGR